MDDLTTRHDPRDALHLAWSLKLSEATGMPLTVARRCVTVTVGPLGSFDVGITHRVDLEDVRDVIAALRAEPGEQTAQAAITEAVGDGMVMGVRK